MSRQTAVNEAEQTQPEEYRMAAGKNQITEGVIWKQLLLFFFPILLGTFFQQLYNTADSIIVGKYLGTRALAAVGGSTELLIKLVLGFFVGISSGAGVIISQYYGARKPDGTRQAVSTSILVAVGGGALFTLVGIAAAPWALRAMGTPEELIGQSLIYMRVYFTGMIPVLVYNMGAGIFRAAGNSRMPMYLLIICCLLNIALDILFVPVLRLGVFGAALATTLSQAVSALLVMAALIKTPAEYRLDLRQFHFSGKLLKSILWVGIPVGLQSMMYNFANVLLQTNINELGTATIAAWSVFGKIDGIFWMIQSSLGIAITTFVGQNYGAGKYERVKKSVRVCLGLSLGITLANSVFLIIFSRPLYCFFVDDSQVIETGVFMMRFMVPSYITYICIEILSGAIRGTGETVKPLIITFAGICVFRIFWITAVLPHYKGLRAIILTYPTSWILTTTIFVVYYNKGKWRRQMDKL